MILSLYMDIFQKLYSFHRLFGLHLYGDAKYYLQYRR